MTNLINILETLYSDSYFFLLDELAKFEEDWKMNADKLFPGWNNGFSMLENAGNFYCLLHA